MQGPARQQAFCAIRWATSLANSSSSTASSWQRCFGSAAMAPRSGGDVPEGHRNSDLSPTVCHIGLNRRRDLTMRQDLCLYKDGKKLSLAEIFKVSYISTSCYLASGAAAQFPSTGFHVICVVYNKYTCLPTLMPVDAGQQIHPCRISRWTSMHGEADTRLCPNSEYPQFRARSATATAQA